MAARYYSTVAEIYENEIVDFDQVGQSITCTCTSLS